MYEKTRNLVLNFLKEHFPSLRIKDGFLNDLYVKAFALLFAAEINNLDTVFDRLDLRNYATMSESDLDAVARYYFLSRQQGNNASTLVDVELMSALPVTITTSTTFVTTNGYKFTGLNYISFSSSQISALVSGNNYKITVPVIAVNPGAVYNVGPGAINSLQTSIGQAGVVSVTNPAAAVSGANRETNTELFMRIVRSINTRGLLITRASVATVVLDNFPTVRAVKVVGKGDDKMQRDRFYPVVAPGGYSPYQKSDFGGKRVGVDRFNKSKAYSGRVTTLLPIPQPADLIFSEFLQEEYYSILAQDLDYAIFRGALEFYDDFEVVGLSHSDKVQDIKDWIASDSGLPFGRRIYGSSVTLSGGNLCLGATAEEANPFAITNAGI